jgi:hypothetical protein
MSIGAANLFTRNFWKAYVNPQIDEAGEAAVAKVTSLVVKVGALLVILYLPTQFALDLQLLGGLWADAAGPDLRPFHALVHCAGAFCGLGRRLDRGHMARLGGRP